MWEDVLTIVDDETGQDEGRLFVQDETWDGSLFIRCALRPLGLFQHSDEASAVQDLRCGVLESCTRDASCDLTLLLSMSDLLRGGMLCLCLPVPQRLCDVGLCTVRLNSKLAINTILHICTFSIAPARPLFQAAEHCLHSSSPALPCPANHQGHCLTSCACGSELSGHKVH